MDEGERGSFPVEAEATLSPEVLKAALTGEGVLSAETRLDYARRLMSHALETRDIEAGSMVAQLMDSDPEINDALETILNDSVAEYPDAAYALIRAHLVDHFDARWVMRLKIAALYSLRVAINDADTETIINWLTLIAREPANYELGDVLHYGILAVQERARQDSELARQIVMLAAKRNAANIDTLLDDEELLKALPNNIGHVLRDLNGDPLLLLQNKNTELFLIGLVRAARAGAGSMFTSAAVSQVWEIAAGKIPYNPQLPTPYQPESLIQEWADHGLAFLSVEATEALATLMLSNRRDDLFIGLMRQERGPERLLPHLMNILQNSGRTINDVVGLISQEVGSDHIQPQLATNTYIALLVALEWRIEMLPLIQQLARTLHQYPAVIAAPDVLWNLLHTAAVAKDESIARIAIRRLVIVLDSIEDDTELVEALKRLSAETQWSEPARQQVKVWWREYVRRQPVARLGRLDKALEGQRVLEDQRAVLQTLSGLRRMLGQRTLNQFAQDVQAAFAVLGSLADSFDPSAKRNFQFDPLIAQSELDALDERLTPQERQVLGNNLKELANLVAAMGDNRTRANLIRRSDELDRDLLSGEQTPHSAVDTMKWLAGYWGRTKEEPPDPDKNPPPTTR